MIFFAGSGLNAVRVYGGNVWVVWNPEVLIQRHRLSHREAVRRLCAEFDQDGPDCGYNGVAGDYAAIWWGRADEGQNLTRSPDHQRTLKRFVGRKYSQGALPRTAPVECSG